MAAIDKVKVLVVGDSGVGKSSLVHLICHNEPISNPSWTIGCAVDVKLHEYKEGTPQQNTYFVEMWDMGGSSSHRNSRYVFYNAVHGIILVHDLTNRKSHQNLHRWLSEILNKGNGSKSRGSFDDYDPEQFVGVPQVPILVIGTKLDLVDEARPQQYKRIASVAEECGADEIFLDCNAVRSLAPGSSSSIKLTRFYDKVIEQRFRSSREKLSPFPDSRRLYPHNPKYYHAD